MDKSQKEAAKEAAKQQKTEAAENEMVTQFAQKQSQAKGQKDPQD